MLTHPAERRLTFPLGELEASGQLFIPVGRDSIGAVVILEGLRTAAPRDEALGQQLGPHLAERGLAVLVLGDARAERVLTPQGLAVDRALLACAHVACTSRPSGSTSVGPPKAVTGGALPTNFSMSTTQVLALVAWARLEVPMSSVSVLGSP